MKDVFITGATGYIGQALMAALFEKGFLVHALVRRGSEGKLPPSALPVVGDALDASTFAGAIPPNVTVIHLVGTPHPGPGKGAEFRQVDLTSIRATLEAIRNIPIRQLIYLSVAHPAPVMGAYIAVREEGERLVQAAGVPATIFRPWYVLGPGHHWPSLLAPFYALARWFPPTRESAERLGLIGIKTMVAAMVKVVQNPPASGVQILEVPQIKEAARHDSHH